MTLPLAPWSEVEASLPGKGRHLLACYDQASVVVFAAHSAEIGKWAVERGSFGGASWADDRISRFRLSFPRVMARAEGGEREGREAVLALRLRRDRFDAILRQAVHWREFPDGVYANKGQWRLATRYAQVVMDWAPDVDPRGVDLARFTVRFGVRSLALKEIGDWIVGIEDMGPIAEQWRTDPDPPTPVLRPYPLPEPELGARLLWQPEA